MTYETETKRERKERERKEKQAARKKRAFERAQRARLLNEARSHPEYQGIAADAFRSAAQ